MCTKKKALFRHKKNNFQDLSCKKHVVCIVQRKSTPSKYCDILSVLQNNLVKVVGKKWTFKEAGVVNLTLVFTH